MGCENLSSFHLSLCCQFCISLSSDPFVPQVWSLDYLCYLVLSVQEQLLLFSLIVLNFSDSRLAEGNKKVVVNSHVVFLGPSYNRWLCITNRTWSVSGHKLQSSASFILRVGISNMLALYMPSDLVGIIPVAFKMDTCYRAITVLACIHSYDYSIFCMFFYENTLFTFSWTKVTSKKKKRLKVLTVFLGILWWQECRKNRWLCMSEI